MHRRYSNIDFILAMPYEDALEYISFVMDKHLDELLFQRWIPLQTSMSFDEFKAQMIKPEPKSEKEVLDQTEIILAMFARSRHGNLPPVRDNIS